ncbi:hypothetical protein L1077_21715 [Pseudoalteromonas luteoviolacea]|uniref:helix-turn-helix domain-containing protein n=1 Tax=Pseudoalteromonas luteoviolacea TaxID=43657 RepID=UPI001F20F72E|nr:hypothetical protein [Pseudoalteromonas luteoviolacea]MCF6442052.1 hypothetical protein [Pseudoalteromonas luteoviolacea]
MKIPAWAAKAQELMKAQKVYQKDLVSVFDVKSASAVSHYFSGRNKITPDQLASLAEHLGVSVISLMGEEEHVQADPHHLDTDSLVEALQALVRLDKLPDAEIINLFNTLEKLQLDRIAEVYSVYAEANRIKNEKIKRLPSKVTA